MQRTKLPALFSFLFLSACALQSSVKSGRTTYHYMPPANSSTELGWLKSTKLTSISDAYLAKFHECDQKNTFGGKKLKSVFGCFNDKNRNGRQDKGEYDDKNRVDYLVNFGPKGSPLLFESKMSVDLDGGYLACIGAKGRTDQCPTSYWYNNKPLAKEFNELHRKAKDTGKPIDRRKLPKFFEGLFVQSDVVPFVVLPVGKEITNLSGAKLGDVGVVIYNNQVVPVFVADRGPYFRLGEASLKVFDLVLETRCAKRHPTLREYCVKKKSYSIAKDVTTIIFPNTALPKSELTPTNVNRKISDKALRLYEELKSGKGNLS